MAERICKFSGILVAKTIILLVYFRCESYLFSNKQLLFFKGNYDSEMN